MFGKSSADKSDATQAKADRALERGHVVKAIELSVKASKQAAKADRHSGR
jgi:hypothetical protein